MKRLHVHLDLVKKQDEDEAICYQASCYMYIPGLYAENNVLLAIFKVSIMWILLKTLALAIFASDHDYCNPHALLYV